MADNQSQQDQTNGPSSDEKANLVEQGGAESAADSRRSFLSRTTRKALYLTPVILSLTASQAQAASAGSGTS